MSDSAVLTKAEEAVFYVYNRVQADPDFAWHMLKTQSLYLCIQAVAEHTGKTEEETRKAVEKNAACHRIPPKLVEARQRIEQLEQELSLAEVKVLTDIVPERVDLLASELKSLDHYLNQLANVEDLIRLAELGYDVLSVDNLRDALAGRALCLC